MAITDELRRYASYAVTDRFKQSMLAIADHIDAALAERYVELPKGVDHEYIHEGDKVEWRSHDGVWNEAATVAAVCSDGCYINVGLVVHVSRFNVRHYHEPTVEDVLHKLVGRAQALDCVEAEDALVAEFAAKLRLAESEG